MSNLPVRRILVVSGPNLDRLGTREPAIYGPATLADIHRTLKEEAWARGVEAVCVQSNHEGELVTIISRAGDDGFNGILLNAGAYTHTSIAIMDALVVLTAPVVEVHISDIHAREEFRHTSYVSLVADDAVIGKGVEGYAIALRRVHELLSSG